MPKEESNQVAGLINFVRNLGGSIMIAITNAQVTSRSLWHQQHLQGAMQSGSNAFEQHRQALTGYFTGTFGEPNSGGMALASIYNQLNQQAAMQGFQDVYMQEALPSAFDWTNASCFNPAFRPKLLFISIWI